MTARPPLPDDDGRDWFWKLIDDADRDRDRLARLLSRLTRQEVARFRHHFEEAAVELTDAPFTDHIEDLSEDGIQDVAEWVVSQGRAFYSLVRDDPAMIPPRIHPGDPTTLSGVADNVHWEKFGGSIPGRGE